MMNLYNSDFSQFGGGMTTFDATNQFNAMNGYSDFNNFNAGAELAMPLVSNRLDMSELGLMNGGFGGFDMGTGMGMDPSLGMNMGMGMDPGFGMNMGMGMDPGFGMGMGMGMGMDMGVGVGMGMGMGMDNLGMDMVMDKMAFDAMGMGMGMGMGMEMAAMGFGMNGDMCLDQCNMGNQCCEHCHCCECQCEEVVGCNVRYLCPLGVIRLAIIICLIAGSAAAWAISWDLAMFYAANAMFWSTREGYIVVAAIALFFSFMFFLFGVLNIYNLRGVSPLFWIAFVNFWDLLMLLGMLGVSIAACVREAQVPTNDFEDVIHQGAFVAAGVCGLLAVALYVVHMVCTIPIAMALY